MQVRGRSSSRKFFYRFHIPIFAFKLSAIVLLTGVAGCSPKEALGNLLKTVSSASSSQSVAAKAALAEHLGKSGARMYGTFWCPYCRRQEELFGDAATKLTIVECDPKGTNAQPNMCAQANISSYPTWEIKGNFYRGMLSLDELADISGYQGSRDFGK